MYEPIIRDFFSALFEDNPEDVRSSLLNYPELVELKNEKGESALHLAKSADIASVLIEFGADVNAKDLYSWTPLHFQENLDLAKTLISHNALVDARGNNGRTPLHCAVYKNATQIVRLLLENNANPNLQENTDGQTPLHLAVDERNFETLGLLFEYSANPNICDIDGWTPLYLSLIGGDADPKVSLFLLEHGADPNIQESNSGLTPLHVAAEEQDSEIGNTSAV
jgi:ankyrin-1